MENCWGKEHGSQLLKLRQRWSMNADDRFAFSHGDSRRPNQRYPAKIGGPPNCSLRSWGRLAPVAVALDVCHVPAASLFFFPLESTGGVFDGHDHLGTHLSAIHADILAWLQLYCGRLAGRRFCIALLKHLQVYSLIVFLLCSNYSVKGTA